nr:TIGR02301 family protein [uncultured Gellertiella sp.]
MAVLSLGLALATPVGAARKPKADPAPVTASTPQVAPAEQPAPYDRPLLRLSEILGSVHYLRSLCNSGEQDQWRQAMQQLIEVEAGKEPLRRQKFTAAFNHGYRSFAALHATCTASAVQAEARYRAEGATLATEITARFGN